MISAPDQTTKPLVPPVPRSVAIAHDSAQDGRIPVTVTVMPLADLDAKGGVWIDLRRGPRRVRPGAEPATALAPREKAAPAGKTPLVSHQIAPGRKLTTGQAASASGSIAVPEVVPDAEVWYLRGRFATAGGTDLTSAWLPI